MHPHPERSGAKFVPAARRGGCAVAVQFGGTVIVTLNSAPVISQEMAARPYGVWWLAAGPGQAAAGARLEPQPPVAGAPRARPAITRCIQSATEPSAKWLNDVMPAGVERPVGRRLSQRSQIVVAPLVTGYSQDGHSVCTSIR